MAKLHWVIRAILGCFSNLRSKESLEITIKQLSERIKELEKALELSETTSLSIRKQALGLREWIRHVHRLDSIPVSGTIKDILQKAAHE